MYEGGIELRFPNYSITICAGIAYTKKNKYRGY